VDRERCILELERTIFDQEVREVHVEYEQALERCDRACNETNDVESDLARVQAEGPANHRKRDHIDKVQPPYSFLLPTYPPPPLPGDNLAIISPSFGLVTVKESSAAKQQKSNSNCLRFPPFEVLTFWRNGMP
jgi:hypothetical protein